MDRINRIEGKRGSYLQFLITFLLIVIIFPIFIVSLIHGFSFSLLSYYEASIMMGLPVIVSYGAIYSCTAFILFMLKNDVGWEVWIGYSLVSFAIAWTINIPPGVIFGWTLYDQMSPAWSWVWAIISALSALAITITGHVFLKRRV